MATNTICILNNTEYVIDTASHKVSEKSIYTEVDTFRKTEVSQDECGSQLFPLTRGIRFFIPEKSILFLKAQVISHYHYLLIIFSYVDNLWLIPIKSLIILMRV